MPTALHAYVVVNGCIVLGSSELSRLD